MKKLVSFLLVCLILLNSMGYLAFFAGVQIHRDNCLTDQLDTESYDESELVTIRIPIALPYLSDNEEFRRVEGEFSHAGEFFRLVKQKYSNDTLTIFCIRDEHSKIIHSALKEFVKLFTDKSHGPRSRAKTTISHDYYGQTFSIAVNASGWNSELLFNTSTAVLTPSYSNLIKAPPRG